MNSWDLDIEVMNGAGNLLERTRNVDGAISYVWQIGRYFTSFANWIWDQVTSALRTAAAAVSQLEGVLEAWVMNKAQSMVESVISPIESKIEGWASRVNSLLDFAMEEYQLTGDLSLSTLEAINDEFLYLQITVFAAATALVVALNALMVLSGGVASLSSLIIPICIAVIMTGLFNSDVTEGIELGGISPSMGIDAILDFSENYLGGLMSGSNSLDDAQLHYGIEPGVWGGISAMFGWGSFIFGASAIVTANMDITGNLAAIWGISAALLGVALGLAAVMAPGHIGLLAFIFGVESLVLSLITLYQMGGTGGPRIAALISFGLAGISVYYSLKSLDYL